MPRRPSKPRPRTYPLVEFLFAAGTLLVILGFFYALRRSWPALDPLSLVMLVGIGLLLVVVCERLRLILRELQELTTVIRRATVEAPEEAPH
ncbi:MAG TPA: hypothetical protein VIG07_19940 [Methylomirabilota bacterium]|jgi:hypothetical protein